MDDSHLNCSGNDEPHPALLMSEKVAESPSGLLAGAEVSSGYRKSGSDDPE